ncbi:uncharacterized protein G2W53_042555 [Senna tora]|uniref:Uncharacterized protein n=1 Tax=Senna tora TaxID=362788 RepID=A0A834SU25_9FABA|nr:uncharacterized protein G2W53_042555 [Senna tora]
MQRCGIWAVGFGGLSDSERVGGARHCRVTDCKMGKYAASCQWFWVFGWGPTVGH